MKADHPIHLGTESLLAMNAALVARTLYGAGHRAARSRVERAGEALRRAVGGRDHLDVYAVEGRIVCEGESIAAPRELTDGLLARVRRAGADGLTVLAGVDQADVAELLTQLEQGAAKPSAKGLRLARIDGVGAGAEGAGAGELAPVFVPRSQDHAAAIESVWQLLFERADWSEDVVGAIVAEICAAVAVSSGTMVPLASLKHHDEYTFVHTINVAILAAALSEALGLSGDAVHDVTVAALLHDIGKESVPAELLNKAGELTEEERRVLRTHPAEGARILFNAPGVPDTARVVAYEHHMHLDGTGYPTPPRGWRPALASQIVQVADVFDALRTHRPYRAALSLEASVRELADCAGIWFDADLFEVFARRVLAPAREAA